MSPSHSEANTSLNQTNQLQSEVNALQGDITTLKEQLERVQNSERSVQRELLEAQDKLIDLNKKLTHTKRDLIDSNDLVTELQEQLRVSETQQRRVSHSLENERFTRQQAESESKRLGEQLTTHQNHSQTEIEDLQAEIQKLNASLSDMSQQSVIELDREKSSNQEILDETIRYHEQRYSEIESVLNSERATLRQELGDQKEKEVSDLQQEFEERVKETQEELDERLEEQARDHRTAMEQAQSLEEDLQVQLSELKRTIEANDSQTRRSVSELNNFRAEKSKLERELEKLQVNFDQEQNRHFDTQQELDDLRKQAHRDQVDFEKIIENLNGEVSQRDHKAQLLSLEKEDTEQSLTKQKQAYQTLEDKQDDLQSDYDALEGILGSERQGFKANRQELEDLRSDFKELESELNTLESKRSYLEHAEKDAQDKITTLETERDAWQSEQQSLQDDLQSKSEVIELLNQEKARIEGELADMRTEASLLQEQCEDLLTEKSQVTERIQEIEQKRDVAQEQIVQTQEELFTMIEQQEQLEDDNEQFRQLLTQIQTQRDQDLQNMSDMKRTHISEIAKRDEQLANVEEDLSFEQEKLRSTQDEFGRFRQKAVREVKLERQGRERLNLQAMQLNAQINQFAHLSQKIGQSLEIAQLFLDHMQEVELDDEDLTNVQTVVTNSYESHDSIMEEKTDAIIDQSFTTEEVNRSHTSEDAHEARLADEIKEFIEEQYVEPIKEHTATTDVKHIQGSFADHDVVAHEVSAAVRALELDHAEDILEVDLLSVDEVGVLADLESLMEQEYAPDTDAVQSDAVQSDAVQPMPQEAEIDDDDDDDFSLDMSIDLALVSSVPPEEVKAESHTQSLSSEEGFLTSFTQEGSEVEIDFDDEEDADDTHSPGAILSGPPQELDAEQSSIAPASMKTSSDN